MSTQLPVNNTEAQAEHLSEGGTWLLDLVSAVDHLRRGHRPGLSVWDALEEAVRWTHQPHDGAPNEPGDEPDPLSATLYTFVITTPVGTTSVALQEAVRRWVAAMGERFNDGRHWPHPTPRRGFPPPLRRIDTDPGADDWPAEPRDDLVAVTRSPV